MVSHVALRVKVLLLVASIFFANGLSILLNPNAVTYAKLDKSIKAHLTLVTPDQIGWLFVGLGIAAWLCVAFDKISLGYGLLMFQTTFWTLLYILSWAETGFWRAIFGGAQYVFLSLMLFFCSRVIEATPLPPQDNTLPKIKVETVELEGDNHAI